MQARILYQQSIILYMGLYHIILRLKTYPYSDTWRSFSAPLRDGGVEGLGDGAFIASEMDLSSIFTDDTSSFSDDTTYSQ